MSVQRGGLNLNYGEYYREYRYLNFVKSAQRPICNIGSGLGYLQMTDDAFPTEATTGVSLMVYVPPNPEGGSSTYVVKWRGMASYSHVSFGSTTSSSRTYGDKSWTGCAQSVQTLNGRMTFTIAEGGQYSSSVTLKGNGSVGAENRLTEFVICRLDEEDLLDSGVKFRPAFLDLIADFNPMTLRFMDSQLTNKSLLSNWGDRPRQSAMTIHYQPWVRSRIVSGTANPGEIAEASTNVYEADAYPGMPVAYEHGEMVHGHVTVSSSSTTPTLQVGGRGAKTISLGELGALSTAGTNYQTQLIAAGTTISSHLVGPYTFVFDAFYDEWILWEGPPQMGHPIEDLLDLCIAANVGAWFCIPSYANDEFISELGNYLVANWSIDKPIWIEWGNEIWNTIINWTNRVDKWGQETFTSPAIGAGTAAIGAYLGLRTRQTAEILRPIFSAAGMADKLKIMLAHQGGSGNTFSAIQTNVEQKRFQNSNYASISGVNAPINHADYVSYALYHIPTSVLGDSDATWTGTTLGGDLKTHVDAWIANNAVTTGFDWLAETWINDANIQGLVFADGGRFDNFDTLSQAYEKQVVHYEFNHQIMPPSTTWTTANAPWNSADYGGQSGKINQFLLAFFQSDQYESVVQQMLASFYGRRQSLSSALYGMCIEAPWLTFPRLAPLTEIIGGDTTRPPYGNWRAYATWNNKLTRTFSLKN